MVNVVSSFIIWWRLIVIFIILRQQLKMHSTIVGHSSWGHEAGGGTNGVAYLLQFSIPLLAGMLYILVSSWPKNHCRVSRCPGAGQVVAECWSVREGDPSLPNGVKFVMLTFLVLTKTVPASVLIFARIWDCTTIQGPAPAHGWIHLGRWHGEWAEAPGTRMGKTQQSGCTVLYIELWNPHRPQTHLHLGKVQIRPQKTERQRKTSMILPR